MAVRTGRLRAAVAHLRRADPVLAAVIRRVGPCRLRVDSAPPYASLVESIVYQQITGRAAAAIHLRLLALAGASQLRPKRVAQLSDSQLRSVGLSRQKIACLRDLTRHVQDGLALGRLARLPDEAVVQALTQIQGIGRWTAEMFLIFRLGRLDILPLGDHGMRRAMQSTYRRRKLPDKAWASRIAEPWRPYRSVACWYLWRSVGGAAGGAA